MNEHPLIYGESRTGQITYTDTRPGDYTIVDHLIDSCDSLIRALRELQGARPPKSDPDADLIHLRIQPEPSLTQAHTIARKYLERQVAPDPPPARTTTAERIARSKVKYAAIDALVDEAIGEPAAWHCTLLEPWQRTKAGLAQVKSRIQHLSGRKGVKIQTTRFLDDGDDGSCLHITLRAGGAE